MNWSLGNIQYITQLPILHCKSFIYTEYVIINVHLIQNPFEKKKHIHDFHINRIRTVIVIEHKW